MIRIIYSWKVEPEKLDLFIETWQKTTTKIHEEVSGARGSFMLHSQSDECEIKTVARWNSTEDWQNFWENAQHKNMQSMHELGERISVEIFDEIDDFTL